MLQAFQRYPRHIRNAYDKVMDNVSLVMHITRTLGTYIYKVNYCHMTLYEKLQSIVAKLS